MKKISYTLVFLMLSVSVIAQELDASNKIPSTYDRSSITVLFLDFSKGNYWEQVKEKISSMVFSDKYDNNNLDELFLTPSFSRDTKLDSPPQEILKDVDKIDAARQIIAKWYSRQPDGTMSLDLVNQRGRFSATDADYLRAQSTKRGSAALEDFGNRLVNLSYILVIDVQNIQTMNEAGLSNLRGFKATSIGYLYKVDFNDEIRYAFYDTWIYDDDSEQVKQEKQKKFNELEFPIKFVTQKIAIAQVSQPNIDVGFGKFKPKTNDEFLNELAYKCYDEVLYLIERDVKEFQVVTPLYGARPLSAKIGLKEGLKTDNRFFVYEHVYNQRTGEVEPRRRGVIRAKSKSKIVDNRRVAMGDMDASEFYQVAGLTLREGYTLQQQNDMGIEVTVGGELGLGIGGAGGFHLRADYRLGRMVGIRALFTYFELGLDSKDYDYTTNNFFTRVGLGVAKGFQVMRNAEVRPYVGFGAELTNEPDLNDEAIYSPYIRGGANLAFNLKHNFQVVGGLGYYGFTIIMDSENTIFLNTWNQVFPGRSGPTALIALKFML